jgi:hypothetical protein
MNSGRTEKVKKKKTYIELSNATDPGIKYVTELEADCT